MNEAIVKDEVIEETCSFTFKNGEYVEVKKEDIEQKPEFLLEKEIKTESIDFFEDVKPKPKECDYPMEVVFKEANTFQCKICQKRMPRNSLKLIRSEEDVIVLTVVFNVILRMEAYLNYACYSHIRKIIHDIDDGVKLPGNPSDYVVRSFVRRNKYLMKGNHSRRGICNICHISKDRSELYQISSNGIRMVTMIGCILRGTHSVEQAKSYVTYNNGRACYSHQKESIDMIFEYLGVSNIQEFSQCPRHAMGGLVDIVQNIDSNFTAEQFILELHLLHIKKSTI
ncbi:hypothetical protein B9Z55_021095 [Caenorhabditis nigoni]|uniref:Lin-15A/B-like domain-containing protein n=2 Tax=Caenorhabditis nigoni TaxID=1611254 RepID=A0A2G5TRB3_9PELO|nr:hypothetical protein B9Z55_021095 [Caenorhabditis nigoni]